jgi:serine/threonine-protein kinase RsbW
MTGADPSAAQRAADDVVASTTGDRIRLVLPAEPDYGRIARVAASSLALRLGFSFAEIEDLRLAVDEMVILLMRPEGAPGAISIEFQIEADALVIEARSTAGEDQTWLDTGARHRFDQLVSETVDEHEVNEAANTVRLVKRY